MTAPIVRKCWDAGYTVDLGNGDAYPTWQPDMAAVRRLLLERAITNPTASPSRPNLAEVNA